MQRKKKHFGPPLSGPRKREDEKIQERKTRKRKPVPKSRELLLRAAETPDFFWGGQGEGSWKGRRKRNKRALQPAVKLCGRGRGGGGRGERSNSEKEGSPHSSKKKNSMLSLKKKTLLFFSLEGGNGQEKKPLLFSPRPVSKLTQNRFLHPLGKKQLFFVLFLL